MQKNRFQKFAILGLLYVNLGRPQDVLPFLKDLHPGGVFSVLVLYVLFQDRHDNRAFNGDVHALKKWFGIFWLLMLFSTLSSIYFRASIEFIFEYSKVILLLWGLVSLLEDEQDLISVAQVFAVSVLTLCLPLLAGGLSMERTSVGTFYDPNDIAMFIACALPFVLFLLHAGKSRVRMVALPALGSGIVSLIATQSRMGFLALILNGLFYLFLSQVNSQSNLRKLALVGGMVLLFAFTAGDIYWDRIKTTFETGQTGSGRTLMWERSLKMLSEHPVVGVGPGTFISAYGRTLQAGGFETVGNEYDRAWKAAHNSYLVVAVELGDGGFLAFLMIILASLRGLNRARKTPLSNEKQTQMRNLVNMVIASFGVYLFCAMFLSQAYSSLLMTLVACSMLIARICAGSCEKVTESARFGW